MGAPRRGRRDIDDLGRLHLVLGEVTDEEPAEALERPGWGLVPRLGARLISTPRRCGPPPNRARPLPTGPPWGDVMVAKARVHEGPSADGANLQVHVESAAGA